MGLYLVSIPIISYLTPIIDVPDGPQPRIQRSHAVESFKDAHIDLDLNITTDQSRFTLGHDVSTTLTDAALPLPSCERESRRPHQGLQRCRQTIPTSSSLVLLFLS